MSGAPPDDVRPVPLPARTPRIDPGTLSGAGADLYAGYARGERAGKGADFLLVDEEGQLIGPPAAWMLAPELGLGLERVGYEMRFGLSITPRHREIVILLVAAAEDNDFERFAHRQAARHAGLTDDEIAALDVGAFRPVDEYESALTAATLSVLTHGALEEDDWDRAEAVLGSRTIFEVVTLVGWYRLVALQLRVFRIEPPSPAAGDRRGTPTALRAEPIRRTP